MADNITYMVAGLGNPGKEYSQTRHNIGFLSIEELAHKYNLSFNTSRFDAYIAKGSIEKKQTILVKPQSYMNRSGFPIQRIASYFKIEIDNIIVVHDELDLPFGRIMVVKDRGHGGHNGVRSIIEEFGTKNFIRVRVGVGRPLKEEFERGGLKDVTNHVLGKFTDNEQKEVNAVVKKVVEASVVILSKSLETAMNSFNS